MLQAAPAFKHVVIIFQENRTPDNLFGSAPGFEPGVDIATSGVNSKGVTIPLQPVSIASCYDLSHAHSAFTAMYDNGKMDGADKVQVSYANSCPTPANAQFAYADNSAGDITPYFTIAEQYGFANRMFQTNQGPSFPAHQFIFGGTSAPDETSHLFAAENMVNGGNAGCTGERGQRVAMIGKSGDEAAVPPVFPCFQRPTMADLLDAAGLSWTYYMNNAHGVGSIWNAPAAIKDICGATVQDGVTVCAGPEYVGHVQTAQAQVLTDIADCKLPAVTWVIPNGKDSDHAETTGTTGPAWVASIVNAIGTQPKCGTDTYWQDTAIFITWDDWGGWYDHVPPFHTGGWKQHDWGAGYTYGFRVPLLVVSAYTPAGTIDNAPHDFGSLLAFIEGNFGLSKIGPGYYADAFGSSLLSYFTLASPRPFTAIPAREDAAYFLHRAPSDAPPDND